MEVIYEVAAHKTKNAIKQQKLHQNAEFLIT